MTNIINKYYCVMYSNTRNMQKSRGNFDFGHVNFRQVVKPCSLLISSHADKKVSEVLAEYMPTIRVINTKSLTKSVSASSFNLSVNATANLHVKGRKREQVDMITCKIT